MHDPLLGPRIKIDRAKHHLRELEQLEIDFFRNSRCQIVFDTDSHPGHKLAKVVLDARPPEIMHVLTGELIYQLRSALDQTAVAFARLSKGPTKPKKVYFPTGESCVGFRQSCVSVVKSIDNQGNPTKRIVGKVLHFDADLRKTIISTRPYNGGNDDLRSVFILANIDKHMELIAMGASGEISGISDYNIYGACSAVVLGDQADLRDGIVFSDLFMHGTIAPKNANAKISVDGQIVLQEGVGPAHSGRPLIPLLRSMLDAVVTAHESFEAILIDRGDMQPKITYWSFLNAASAAHATGGGS